jgi:hypothetical protein
MTQASKGMEGNSMDRKSRYLCSLIGFFLMWGIVGFAATAPRRDPPLQTTMPPRESTLVVPGATSSAGIPVTAEPEPLLTEVIVFYGLIGLTALFLVLALLNVANKPPAPYVRHEHPSSKKTNRD